MAVLRTFFLILAAACAVSADHKALGKDPGELARTRHRLRSCITLMGFRFHIGPSTRMFHVLHVRGP